MITVFHCSLILIYIYILDVIYYNVLALIYSVFFYCCVQVPSVKKDRKATEERKARRGISASWDRRESRVLAPVYRLRAED